MDIPEDIAKKAREAAEDVSNWLKGGNSVGHLSEHAVDGLADTVARIIMAERLAQRERDAQIAASHYNITHDDQVRFAGAKIAAAIRQTEPR